MTEVTLHPRPRYRDVVLEQIRFVGLSLRPGAGIIAVVLGLGTLVIANELAGGGPGFDTGETFATPFIAFLYAFAVWRGERRFGPAFLWTLPVDRRRLAFAKVFAGLVWLMAALAVFLTWLLAMALLAHSSPVYQLTRVPFIATIGAYLLGSALVLGLRHPLRWLFGAAGVLVLMGRLSDEFARPNDGEWQGVPAAKAFFSVVQQAAEAFHTLPDLAQWSITTFLWLGAGLAALWAAAWRHRERRRR